MNIIALCQLPGHTPRIIIGKLELYPQYVLFIESGSKWTISRVLSAHNSNLHPSIAISDLRVIIHTMRGCSDKTPEDTIFSFLKIEREKEKEICEMFATIVLHMYRIYIFFRRV